MYPLPSAPRCVTLHPHQGPPAQAGLGPSLPPPSLSPASCRPVLSIIWCLVRAIGSACGPLGLAPGKWHALCASSFLLLRGAHSPGQPLSSCPLLPAAAPGTRLPVSGWGVPEAMRGWVYGGCGQSSQAGGLLGGVPAHQEPLPPPLLSLLSDRLLGAGLCREPLP